MADVYGIPEGGNNGAWTAKRWKGINHTLSWEEMMAAVALGGWPQSQWAMAGAVASAESSRNPFIYNTYKKGHFGLFQISRSAWPEFFTGDKQFAWTVPWENAKKGYEIYKRQGWGAWEGKTNGAYLAYLPQAKAAAERLRKQTLVHPNDERGFWMSKMSKKTQGYILQAMNVSPEELARVGNEGLAEAIGDAAGATGQATVDTLTATADAINDTFGWLPDLWESLTTPAFWMRVGYGVLGVGLVAGGLFLVVRSTPAGKAAGKVASVVPVGRAVKAVKGAAA